MIRSLPALTLLLGTAACAAAASPDPKSLAVPAAELAKARELVQKLGSERYCEREDAEKDLAKMGRAARTALLEAVTADPSPEVRSRADDLLPRATSLEMKARLEVFLADADGKYEHDLPGWNQFRATVRGEWTVLGHPVGSDRSLDRAARTVFAELLSTPVNRHVVMAVGGPDSQLGPLVAARRQELYNQKYGRVFAARGGVVVSSGVARREPTTDDIAALLFAESQVPARSVPRAVAITALLNASGFITAARGDDDKGKVYRAVAVAWIESRQDPVDLQYAMTVASNLGLNDHSLRLAVRLFESKAAQPFQRGNAAATIARLGNKDHIPLLERAAADETVLISLRRQVVKDGKAEIVAQDIQIRDVALAVSVILAGQKPEDYGFADQFKGNGAGINYSYTRYYLSDDDRKAAFEKWKAYREKGEKK